MEPQSVLLPPEGRLPPPNFDANFFLDTIRALLTPPQGTTRDNDFKKVATPCRPRCRPQLGATNGPSQDSPPCQSSSRSVKGFPSYELKTVSACVLKISYFCSNTVPKWTPVPGSTRHHVMTLPRYRYKLFFGGGWGEKLSPT